MNQTPGEVTTGAYHWIVQRPDGAGFAATSHDRREQYGSTSYEADMDLRPAKLILSDQVAGSALELEGGLSSLALSQGDLLAGRWTGASVQLSSADWSQTAGDKLLCEGEFGAVELSGDHLSISVDLLPAAGRLPPCVQTSPGCRAMLGDRQCRMDMRSRRSRVEVVALTSRGLVIDEPDAERFAFGRLRWTSGMNSGLEQRILATDGAELVLQNALTVEAKVGDRAIVTEGCDGRRATCSQRFGNILNFRGEPDLPGSEVLLRFPGA